MRTTFHICHRKVSTESVQESCSYLPNTGVTEQSAVDMDPRLLMTGAVAVDVTNADSNQSDVTLSNSTSPPSLSPISSNHLEIVHSNETSSEYEKWHAGDVDFNTEYLNNYPVTGDGLDGFPPHPPDYHYVPSYNIHAHSSAAWRNSAHPAYLPQPNWNPAVYMVPNSGYNNVYNDYSPRNLALSNYYDATPAAFTGGHQLNEYYNHYASVTSFSDTCESRPLNLSDSKSASSNQCSGGSLLSASAHRHCVTNTCVPNCKQTFCSGNEQMRDSIEVGGPQSAFSRIPVKSITNCNGGIPLSSLLNEQPVLQQEKMSVSRTHFYQQLLTIRSKEQSATCGTDLSGDSSHVTSNWSVSSEPTNLMNQKIIGDATSEYNLDNETVDKADMNQGYKRQCNNLTDLQVKMLEARFRENPFISNGQERKLLATALNIPEKKIQTWFQNRRTKERKSGAMPRGPVPKRYQH